MVVCGLAQTGSVQYPNWKTQNSPLTSLVLPWKGFKTMILHQGSGPNLLSSAAVGEQRPLSFPESPPTPPKKTPNPHLASGSVLKLGDE